MFDVGSRGPDIGGDGSGSSTDESDRTQGQAKKGEVEEVLYGKAVGAEDVGESQRIWKIESTRSIDLMKK